MNPAKLNVTDVPETDNTICFDDGRENGCWLNAQKYTTNSEIEVVCFDAFGASEMEFESKNLRILIAKLSKWADELEQ